MTTRRDFVRQGALWVAAAAIVPIEEPLKRIWALGMWHDTRLNAVYGPLADGRVIQLVPSRKAPENYVVRLQLDALRRWHT